MKFGKIDTCGPMFTTCAASMASSVKHALTSSVSVVLWSAVV